MTMQAAVRTDELAERSAKAPTRRLPAVARTLMGLVFLASGLFGLLIVAGVVPIPQPPASEGATAFLVALSKTGYLFALIKATEATVGALLLSNRFVPLALALVAPVLVNILAFHLFLSREGIAPGIVLTGLEVYLAWVYRAAFRPMLAPRVGAGAT